MLNGTVVSIPGNVVSTNQSSVNVGDGGARTASHIWDGVIGTTEANTWCSAETPTFPEWASVQYSTEIAVDSIKIYPAVYETNYRSPKTFSIQTSVDGVIWVTVRLWSGQTSWVAGTGVSYSIL